MINGCSVVEFPRMLEVEKLDDKAFPFQRQDEDENKLITTSVTHLKITVLLSLRNRFNLATILNIRFSLLRYSASPKPVLGSGVLLLLSCVMQLS